MSRACMSTTLQGNAPGTLRALTVHPQLFYRFRCWASCLLEKLIPTITIDIEAAWQQHNLYLARSRIGAHARPTEP